MDSGAWYATGWTTSLPINQYNLEIDKINSHYWDCQFLFFLLIFWISYNQNSYILWTFLFRTVHSAIHLITYFARQPRFPSVYLFKTIVLDFFSFFFFFMKKWIKNKSEFYSFTLFIVLISPNASALYIRYKSMVHLFFSC